MLRSNHIIRLAYSNSLGETKFDSNKKKHDLTQANNDIYYLVKELVLPVLTLWEFAGLYIPMVLSSCMLQLTLSRIRRISNPL
jgi:hypothetical protein